MKQVIINGKNYDVEDNSSLKDLLESLGFIFPCGGVGKCGRCRINCKNLETTELDKRFLNDIQLANGVHLACDKKIVNNLNIDIESALLGELKKNVKLTDCRIAVSLASQNISISILDTDIVETVVLPNPLLKYGSYSELSKLYNLDRATFSKLLRNCIGKESVELFEKYGTAKADTIALAGNEFYIKILLGIPLEQEVADYNSLLENDNLSLPVELVYILPTYNNFIGGDIISEMVSLPSNSLLIDCENICVFAYIGEMENTLTAMWDLRYDSLEIMGIKAAIKTLIENKEATPIVYLYGSNSDKVACIVEELGLTHIEKSKNNDNIAKACLFNRFRVKLNKEKVRSTYFNLADNEQFHKHFSEI
jgi:ferredoxin